ncbi:MAG TPA: metallophosphoesterase [Paludibaculum sp.]|jgi:hypothetical protein
MLARLLVFLAAGALSAAEPFTIYVGELGPGSAVLAWGRQEGAGNRIGRGARSYGPAIVRIGHRVVETSNAWARVEGLAPDTDYAWSVQIAGQPVGSGHLRTWAASAARLSFLVIGDYGDAGKAQYDLARVMTDLVVKRADGPDPIRFVLTTGDNIYGKGFSIVRIATGNDDSDWWPRFFLPYAGILQRIPFYPTLGNHDGNESESHADLPVYLDNFFFPGGEPRRYYHFRYANLADFFALDSTSNTESGPPRPAYLPDGAQTAWLREQLPLARAPWRFAYFHHSLFNAGPAHDLESNELRFKHWLQLFSDNGVQVTFQGHEHNFQASRVNARSYGIRHFVTGSGGALRDGDVRTRMDAANVEAWSPHNQFLLVELRDAHVFVTPIGVSPIVPVNSAGSPLPAVFSIP